MSMPDRVLSLGYLSLIQMPFTIPLSRKVVLILAPGNTCHKMNGVPSIFPGFHPFRKRHPSVSVRWISAYAIDHDRIRPIIDRWTPLPRCLKRCLHFVRRLLCHNRSAASEQTRNAYICSIYHNLLFACVILPIPLLHLSNSNVGCRSQPACRNGCGLRRG